MKLNQAQTEAVNYIDGPLLVIAGPGTGKTQLLSHRVANILNETDTDPGSILCLTFTNFAATNMRERLNDLIGPSAHSVMVKTFHSFAAEIMSLYPDYFWNGARLTLVPEAVQLDIIQGLLSKLPLDNPLAIKFANNFTATSDVVQALRLAKEAGLTPQKLTSILEHNLAYTDAVEPKLSQILATKLSLAKLDGLAEKINKLPDQATEGLTVPLISLSSVLKASFSEAVTLDKELGKCVNTGKWKRRWLQTVKGQAGLFDERKRHQWWLAFAEVYELYREELHRRGYYDYSDMLIEVISVLEQDDELLASVQERFLYVLIDEFQDTNAAQLRLAHLVASHYADNGRPNIMAVGDDDQSIFAFNGAELNNMLSFRNSYKDVKTVVLSENYRSTQAVLDIAQTVIEQAGDRLVKRVPDINKQLKSVTKQVKGQLTHFSYPTREHQLSALADSIKKTWQEDKQQTIAVLARSHDSLRQLSAQLQQLNIPIRYEQQNDILNLEVISQIALLAEIIVAINEGDQTSVNYSLPRLLAHEAWQVKPEELWRLALTNRRQGSSWLDSLAQHDNKQLKVLAKWLMWLAKQSTVQPLNVMIEYLVGLRTGEHLTSPLRQYFLKQKVSSDYLESLSGLNVLQSLTKEFLASQGQPKLSDLTRFIKLSQSLGRPITDTSWFMSGERAVQLLTVHKAKGLEFDTVFIIDAIEEEWRPRHIGRKPPANLPLQPYGEHYDDYVRLAYVAVTRARRSVIVSSYNTNLSGEAILASPLFGAIELKTVAKANELSKLTVLENSLSWPRLSSSNQKALLSARLSEYRLTSTGLEQFLNLVSGGPQHFLESQLLRLPELTTDQMGYGTAVHRALQVAQQLINASKFKLATILTTYREALISQQLTVEATERYLVHGQNVLKNLFKLGFSLPKDGQAEVKFNELSVADIPLSGTLDNVQLSADRLLISDYKTGAPLANFTSRAEAKALKAWRQRRQLLFYCLLAQASGRYKAAKQIKAQLVYVEAESQDQLTLGLEPTKEELDHLLRLMQAVWRRIKDLNFPDTSNYEPSIKGIMAFEEALLKDKK